MLDLSIVILNYNTRDLLRQCLSSVMGSSGTIYFETWVVDNASTDDSIDMIQQEFPNVKLVLSTSNGGYSYGNNLGLRAAGFRAHNCEANRSGHPGRTAPYAGFTNR